MRNTPGLYLYVHGVGPSGGWGWVPGGVGSSFVCAGPCFDWACQLRRWGFGPLHLSYGFGLEVGGCVNSARICSMRCTISTLPCITCEVACPSSSLVMSTNTFNNSAASPA
jgi:hypothetical protein